MRSFLGYEVMNERFTMETTTKTMMSPAVRGAVAETVFTEFERNEREGLDINIAAARKGVKVCKNDANPSEIRAMITVWEHEMYFRLCEERERLMMIL